MNAKLVNGLSVALAVVLHVVIIGVLLMTWGDAPAAAAQVPDDRLYIYVAMVSENPHRARAREEARRKAAERARRAQTKPRVIPRPEKPEAPRPAPKPEPVVMQEHAPAPVEAEPEPEPAEAVSDEERLRMEQSLALAILEEQEYRRAVTDDEKAQAYAAQIKRDIGQNWASPPSARNGMQALLRVYLVPTGEVVNVTLEETSGNDAFDRSAILAVRKAGRFDVPSESRQFERNFREFTVLFRPENLRL
ncbi:MAG: protein TolA [Gammaproteobacteria bacterium]|nr:protein TolA [Gammaproteobacteria bacterium]